MVRLHQKKKTWLLGYLELDVDHVIMIDFPLNFIDYILSNCGTTCMGEKGKITRLITKKDTSLATKIEGTIRKN
jgi:superfamily II DNA/RNA helicase